MDGFEFVTHPPSEQLENVCRSLKFSVPESDVALPWMTPVSNPDSLKDPPFAHARGGGLYGSLNCTEHDVAAALHCCVKAGRTTNAVADKLPVLFPPDLVPLMAAVIPERTLLIAFWIVELGGVTGAGVAFSGEGVVGDAQAETSARTPINAAMLRVFVNLSTPVREKRRDSRRAG